MTTVCLKSKNSLSTETWSNVFTGLNREVKSYLYIKQLTSACISTILYLRKVLPDDYFEEEDFEGMSLKLLKWRKGENYVSKIEQWLEGAFDAIQKQYLKELKLDIQDSESDMTVEIYTMIYNYNKENEELQFLASAATSSNTSCISTSNTNSNTIKLLQMCEAVTQNYSDLPSKIKLSMRLIYYENTPEDYQPKGYKAGEPEDPKFPRKARSIEIGTTNTQFHFFKLLNKSCLSDKFFQDLEEHTEQNSSSPVAETDDKPQNNSPERGIEGAKRKLCYDNPKKCVQSSSPVIPKGKPEPTFLVTEKCTSVPSDQHKPLEKPSGNKAKATTIKENNISNRINIADARTPHVRCVCLLSDKTSTMLPCLGCKFFVHAECYGILHFDSTIKVRFYCHLCHQADNNLKCHDKVIMSLKNSSDQQKLSILRRVLRYCNKPEIRGITLKRMEKILGSSCPINLINTILNKMIELGVTVPQAKKKTYLIDKKALADKLVYYFYKKQNQSPPYSLRTQDSHEFLFSKRSKHSRNVTHDLLCK